MMIKRIKGWHQRRKDKDLIYGVMLLVKKGDIFDDSDSIALLLWSNGYSASDDAIANAYTAVVEKRAALMRQCIIANEAADASPNSRFADVQQDLADAIVSYTTATRKFFETAPLLSSRE